MNGAQALIHALELQGTTTVFGYPGGQVLALYDALLDSSIRHITTGHEQAAAHAADGYARVTGKPGVVFTTSGPGATNTITGIACAYMDSIPLVVVTGQVPTSVIGSDAFQESDTTGITLPITKHSYLVTNAEDIPRIVHEAFYIASTGRPGPVLIDLPSDIAQAKAAFDFDVTLDIASYKPTYKGNARQCRLAAELLLNATRPVLYCGGGIKASGAFAELAAFAHSYNIPVVTTLLGKTAFPESDSLSLGMSGEYGTPEANYALLHADLVIAIGARFSDRTTGKVLHFAPNAKFIHIDIDPAEIGKNQAVDCPIVGDAKNVLLDLISRTQEKHFSLDYSSWLAEVTNHAGKQKRETRTPKENYLLASTAMQSVASVLKAHDCIVTTEVGQHQMWAAQYVKLDTPRSFLSSGGLGAMGFGFPAALGAQCAVPHRPVVCIAGDGSFCMNIQEMATAKEAELNVKVIIFDNECLGLVRQLQEEMQEGRYSSVMRPSYPDYSLLAQAYGWYGAVLDSTSSIAGDTSAAVASAVETLLAQEGPGLLVLKIAREESVVRSSAFNAQAQEAEGNVCS